MELIHVSVAVSLDGFINDNSPERLILSSQEDLEDMYACRAECDAILVGAETIRSDNPSLLFKQPYLVERRRRKGLSPELIKVTLTNSGILDPKSKFFTAGDSAKIVLCRPGNVELLQQHLGTLAELIPLNTIEPTAVLSALQERGVQRLFIEGGRSVLTQFISAGLFHLLRVAVAPLFVGDSRSPRFVADGKFLNGKKHRLRLIQARALGDTTVMEFANDHVPSF
jgi:5-amino-6-(5-phosphoribosylamino)uracil reductase